MGTMHFRDARRCVLETVAAARVLPAIEEVPLDAASGRVLAESVQADRDYPALARSTRDGFAVLSDDVPGRLKVTGEARAGTVFAGEVHAGEAVEIMTGAPVPHGANAVVMVEHTRRDGEMVECPAAAAGQFIDPQGSYARTGAQLLAPGWRIEYTAIAMLASAGKTTVRVYRKPRVAILSTGDEIVEAAVSPLPHQIRDSNAHSLAAQVSRAGGAPLILPVAQDTLESARWLIERGLASDLLLISGGVSAGKYDLVEQVLAEAGAEFFFDRVLIQPGQPVVFGRARDTFFFGLPGNPASTMVTFETLARSAVELLAGECEPAMRITLARLTQSFRHKPGLTRFLPAHLAGEELTPIAWHGSGDIPALARANAFLVADPERESWDAGEPVQVLIA